MKSLIEAVNPIQKINITRELLTEDGRFPNNGLLPLLHYSKALQISVHDETDLIKELLETNGWTNSWVDGIYAEHHYHSNTHEVLVAVRGMARVQFGGPNGVALPFEQGDVVIIPAGVAHMKLEEADGFLCLGAYPGGEQYDMYYGKEGERPKTDENIRAVPLPQNDPLYGQDGPLIKNWSSERNQPPSPL